MEGQIKEDKKLFLIKADGTWSEIAKKDVEVLFADGSLKLGDRIVYPGRIKEVKTQLKLAIQE